VIIVASASDLISAVNAVATAEPGNPTIAPAGEEILILPGSYTFTSPIDLPIGLTLRGSGYNTTYLNFTGGSDGFVFNKQWSGGGVSGVTVRGMTILTTSSPPYSGSGRGFSVNYLGNAPVTDLGPMILADLNMSCDGIAIDLDPAAVRAPATPIPAVGVNNPLTQSGGTATANTAAAHGFTTGQVIAISGASIAGYNGSFVITVTSSTQFTYAVSNSLGSASGTITAMLAPQTYCQQVFLDNINFASCNAGLITMNGDANELRLCQVANHAGTGSPTVTDGLVRVTGGQNLLKDMIIGIIEEVPACYYLSNLSNQGTGSFQMINCWAEGGQLDRGIHVSNSLLAIDQFVFVPGTNPNFVAVIDAENSTITQDIVDLVSAYALTAQGGYLTYYNLDSSSSAAMQTVLAARDVGNLYDPQIAMQQTVSTGILGYFSAYTLNYPPPVRASNLFKTIDNGPNWTYTATSGITVSSSGPQSNGKTTQYFVYVTAVPAGVGVTTLAQLSGTATAATASAHGFSVGQKIRVSGATPAGFNGLVNVATVPSSTSFTYAVDSLLSTPASGTITAAPAGTISIFANVNAPSSPITSPDFTLQYNAGVVNGDEDVICWYNGETTQLISRRTNTLTATLFAAGATVTDIDFEIVGVVPGYYTITDAGLWTTF
jgi:hypothetical protein